MNPLLVCIKQTGEITETTQYINILKNNFIIKELVSYDMVDYNDEHTQHFFIYLYADATQKSIIIVFTLSLLFLSFCTKGVNTFVTAKLKFKNRLEEDKKKEKEKRKKKGRNYFSFPPVAFE